MQRKIIMSLMVVTLAQLVFCCCTQARVVIPEKPKPVVYKNTVFEAEGIGRIIARDVESKKILWSKEIFQTTKRGGDFGAEPLNGFIVSLAIEDGNLVAVSNDGEHSSLSLSSIFNEIDKSKEKN